MYVDAWKAKIPEFKNPFAPLRTPSQVRQSLSSPALSLYYTRVCSAYCSDVIEFLVDCASLLFLTNSLPW